jgi:flagellar biosynthesis/type III secretory pathway M-ring protein FliF/YscJ
VSNFENKYIKLTLTTGQNTYNFNVNVKDSNFQDPGFPKTNEGTPTEPTKSRVGWGIITLIIIIALLVAAIVFYVMNKQIKKQ